MKIIFENIEKFHIWSEKDSMETLGALKDPRGNQGS